MSQSELVLALSVLLFCVSLESVTAQCMDGMKDVARTANGMINYQKCSMCYSISMLFSAPLQSHRLDKIARKI